MSDFLFDPQTGTVLDAAGVVLVSSEAIESRLGDLDPRYGSVNEALLDEDDTAVELAIALGSPVVTETAPRVDIEPATITVSASITTVHEAQINLGRIADSLSKDDPELAAELRTLDAPSAAARLHRLRLDDPTHPAIVSIWIEIEHDNEVAGEDWIFSA